MTNDEINLEIARLENDFVNDMQGNYDKIMALIAKRHEEDK